ncbi:polyamine aminopropyltransferase [Natronospira bacteriovora]|uniref:Polyamine aminopropyltransferase n=1 Tax=Natronospira bacteriovora TaxID=3069753 RepID=A0ABU0W739_9GAMM|nr:polyamine aminopropyltransferase [Natronospira sp. AB-CW4]MDQ2069837.1 polyamine aminopropyltransferase [Natronospira sp. AB-CW4]
MTVEEKRDETLWFTERADEAGMGLQLRIHERLHHEQSDYQRIEIYDTTSFGKLMVIDGFVMLTDRDNFVYHEMMSHPVLFTHPAPKRVVVIGGGDCGTLREVLRHPGVEEAIQVEIDERVTRLAEQYFPELCDSNDDPRARLLFEDGIEWMRNAPDGSVDVIIVDSTDPVGPAEGLFNRAFYEQCHRALGDGGLLVQQSESPLLHLELIKAMRAAMQDGGFAACHTHQFPQPTYPSGWWSATMARKGRGFEGFREDDAARRGFETLYYTPEVHRGALAMPPFFCKATGQKG